MKKRFLFSILICLMMVCSSFTIVQAQDESTYVSQEVDGVMSNPDASKDEIQAARGSGYNLTWSGSGSSKVMKDYYGNRFGYGTCKKVIDVSQYNGAINWAAVKNSGVDGAILRIASHAGGYHHLDAQFANNLAGCRKYNIPFGVYIFSYATNTTMATAEANFTISTLQKYGVKPAEMAYSVYHDMEGGTDTLNSLSVSRNQSNTLTFLARVRASGYKANVYSYKSYLLNNLNSSAIHKETSWVAQYGKALTFYNKYYKGNYGWQYQSNGRVSGVSGDVDVSCFSNYYGYDTANVVNQPTGKDSNAPTISYRANSQNVGWLAEQTEPNTAGTTGRSLKLYQLKMSIANAPKSTNLSGTIYQSNGTTKTYTNIESTDTIGTSGVGIQQVTFNLKNIPGYTLKYRVHSATVGWQSWVVQGHTAGVKGKNIQAIDFKLVADSSVKVTDPQVYLSVNRTEGGWSQFVPDGATAGATSGTNSVQALKVGIDNMPGYTINSSVYVKGVGWQDKTNITGDTVVGTTGQSRTLKAIKLTSDNIGNNKLQYRAYVQNSGWTSWVNEGKEAGNINGNNILGVAVRIVPIQHITSISLPSSVSLERTYTTKPTLTIYPTNTTDDTDAIYTIADPTIATVDSSGNVKGIKIGTTTLTAKVGSFTTTTNVTVTKIKPVLNYQVHGKKYGWQSSKTNGATAGTTGQSLRVEALKMSLTKTSDIPGNINYRAYVKNIGWQSQVSNNKTAGTTGRSLQVEAIKINLSGDIANYYDVYYRVHCAHFGWTGWASNNEISGSVGYGYELEAMQAKLVPKGTDLAVSTPTSYITNVGYSTHVQKIGWQSKKYNGLKSGTTGQNKRLEAIKITLPNKKYTGSIKYRTHVQKIGWQGYKTTNNVSGTTGRGYRLEAIKIELTGEMAKHYNVVYRTHVQKIGWQSWVKNGQKAGTTGRGLRLEAIEIKLVEK